MKKYFFTIIIFCFLGCTIYGQISTEEEPMSFGRSVSSLTRNGNTQKVLPSLDMETIRQEDMEDEANEKEKKVSYAFIAEHGMYLGFNIAYTDVFVNGICFNKTQNIIGIGVGAEFDVIDRLSIPIYVNYRCYFPSKTNIKPLINIAVGTRLTSQYSYSECIVNRTWKPDFYSTIASGFRIKGFSFTSGLFVKSFKNNFFGGIEIKLGYIIIYNKKINR